MNYRTMARKGASLLMFALLLGGSITFVACESEAEDDVEDAQEEAGEMETGAAVENEPAPATAETAPAAEPAPSASAARRSRCP